ncbi:transposase [candidate division KSB1 bacterium]|nr:MAG: transposase [candidate division KSB1 bacterium]
MARRHQVSANTLLEWQKAYRTGRLAAKRDLARGGGGEATGGAVDDHSRFPLVFRRLSSAKGDEVQELIAKAVARTGMENVPRCEGVHLLSDNGACYKRSAFNAYLKSLGIKHTAPCATTSRPTARSNG